VEDQDKVSREAHERMTRERDELKAQLAQATNALKDLTIEQKLRSNLKGKVADPDVAANLLLPHFREVELDGIPEALGSERFAPIVSMMAAQQAPVTQTDDTPPPTPPTNGQSAFSGPNPGAAGGAPTERQKIRAGSPEFNQIAELPNGKARIAELREQDLIEWTQANPDGGVSISNRFR